MNKEQFKKLGEWIEFIPFGNNPEDIIKGNIPGDAIDGIVFTMEEYRLIFKALFGKVE